eukprot:5625647-Amphidinium_carterae.1
MALLARRFRMRGMALLARRFRLRGMALLARMESAPFQVEEVRVKVVDLLESSGFRVRPRPHDRHSAIDFRLLGSMLALSDDPDHLFLTMVAEQGVPLGVDCTLPRVRKIFGGKKTSWSVQQETGELGG